MLIHICWGGFWENLLSWCKRNRHSYQHIFLPLCPTCFFLPEYCVMSGDGTTILQLSGNKLKANLWKMVENKDGKNWDSWLTRFFVLYEKIYCSLFNLYLAEYSVAWSFPSWDIYYCCCSFLLIDKICLIIQMTLHMCYFEEFQVKVTLRLHPNQVTSTGGMICSNYWTKSRFVKPFIWGSPGTDSSF